MRVTISRAGPPIDPERLNQVERYLGRPLPPAYRAFLLHTNGGEPDLDHYPITGMPENPFGEIRMFLGLGAAADYDDLETTRALLLDRLPPDFLAIGYSSGDDMICLSLRAEDFGAVYFWDSQSCSEPTSVMDTPYTNTFYIAKDFDQFIESLNSYESFAR